MLSSGDLALRLIEVGGRDPNRIVGFGFRCCGGCAVAAVCRHVVDQHDPLAPAHRKMVSATSSRSIPTQLHSESTRSRILSPSRRAPRSTAAGPGRWPGQSGCVRWRPPHQGLSAAGTHRSRRPWSPPGRRGVQMSPRTRGGLPPPIPGRHLEKGGCNGAPVVEDTN